MPELIGRRFSRLTVIGRYRPRYVRVQCTCGNRKIVRGHDLICRRTRSCGCLRSETTARNNFKHGGAHKVEYRLWYGILRRCYEKKNRSYPYYGARGIKVCTSWRKSFKAFYRDMGPRPHPKLTIDRTNNDGPYASGNCRWRTRSEQMRNTRRAERYKRAA